MTAAKIGLEPKNRDHCPQNTQHSNKRLSSSTCGGGGGGANSSKYTNKKDLKDEDKHCSNRMMINDNTASIGTYRPNTQSYRMVRILQQVIFLLALILFKYGGLGSSFSSLASSFFPSFGVFPSSSSSSFIFAFANEGATTQTTEEAETSSGGLPKEAQIVLAVILICLTAVFAGLTIGIMGVDTLTLEIIAEGGNEPDASYAKTLLPVRKMGHHALATLVLGNMWANVMIAQFCADVNPEGGGGGEGEEGASGLIAFFMSTLIILIFGEILPMSVCKSSQALRIAAAGVPLLKVFIVLLYPLAKPLGWMLDTMIHHNVGQIYDRNELKELMKLHASRLAAESGLDTDEGNILVGILEFKDKTIGSVMTKIEDTICVSEDCLIDRPLLKALWAVGRSRVPVVRGTVGTPICITDPRSAVSLDMKQHIVGILYIKDLITYNVKDTTVGEYLRSEQQREVKHILTTDTLPKVMALAQTGVAHMFVVREPLPPKAQSGEDPHSSFVVSPSSVAYNNAAGLLNNVTNATNAVVGGLLPVLGKVVGICTMEDVLEALIKSEIYDENDDEDNLEVEQEMAEMGAATGQSPAAMRRAKATRVNLYSFHIPFPETTVNGSPLANGAQSLTATSSALPTPTVKPLNEVERNAIAKYLRNTVPAFAFWRLGALRALLAEATDEVIMPIAVNNTLEDSNSTIDGSSSVNSPTTATNTTTTTAAAILSSEQQLRNLNSSVREAIALAKTKAATPEAFVNDVPKKNLIARQGVPMGEFIIVLSGCVDVCFGNDGFKSEITTLGFMAESVLMDGKPFVPAFSARVTRRPTRLLRVSYPLYQSHERKLMAQLNATNSAYNVSVNGTTLTATRPTQAAVPQPPPPLLNPIVTRANPTGTSSTSGDGNKTAYTYTASNASGTGVSRPLTSDSLPRPQYVSRFATTASNSTVASSTSPSSPTPLVK